MRSASLPTGRVTFLFADLAGSTQLAETRPADERRILRRYNDLIAAAVAARRGAVVESVGDECKAVFAVPSDAVHAAAGAQRALHAEDWGGIPVRVRMGIHTGDAHLEDGRYYGVSLYRCGRLCSLAGGGQVLLSSATAQLVRDAPDTPAPGIGLKDLGHYTLRGMAEPEHVFQLDIPDLPRDFPPLTTEEDLLKQQAATAEILRVVASSRTDLGAVFAAICESATRLCDATDAAIFQVEGEMLRVVHRHGPAQTQMTSGVREPKANLGPRPWQLPMRLVAERRTIHFPDVPADPNLELAEVFVARTGIRARLGTPLLREGQAIGALVVDRTDARPFTDQQIRLLETFADQAVIAIENARLFRELQEQLEQQTATNAILRAISESPTDLKRVLNQVLANAIRLCGGGGGLVQLIEGGALPIARRLRTRRVDPAGLRRIEAQGAVAAPGVLQYPAAAVRPRNDPRQLVLEGDTALIPVEGGALRVVSAHTDEPSVGSDAVLYLDQVTSIEPGRLSGRAVLERRVVSVDDITAHSDAYPASAAHELNTRFGLRAMLAVPLLLRGEPVGVISLGRTTAGDYTPRQISLVTAFADQAVIALENTRLFQELQNTNRTLTEALEQQTATADILRTISGAPTDLEGVLREIVQAAARLTDADSAGLHRLDRDTFRVITHLRPDRMPWRPDRVPPLASAEGAPPFPPPELGPGGVGDLPRTWAAARALQDRVTIYIPDIEAEPEAELSFSKAIARHFGHRSLLMTPVFSGDEALGVISVQRTAPHAFTDRHASVLETFAAQAVIAIENARLFTELQDRTRELARSVEQLTALSEISHAINSTLDLDQVLSAIVARAVDLSGTHAGTIYEYDPQTEIFLGRASSGMPEEFAASIQSNPIRLGDTMLGQAARERRAIQVPDVAAETAPLFDRRLRELMHRFGFRAFLAVPMLRRGDAPPNTGDATATGDLVGALVVRRRDPGEFSQDTVELLQTFANQSALAIHNARLFRELEAKSRQLEEASRHKSQFLANMSHELRTPLNAILGYAELIADGIYGAVPDRMQEVMERVQASGRHLLGLINAVLDLSKIEAGQLVLAPVDYSLNELVYTVFTATESLAREKGLDYRLEIAPDLPTGHGDERRLHQVLLNLAGNAIKFTDSGLVTLRASTPPPHTTFLIEVQDTGPGVPAEEQDRIFEEFQQADGSITRAKGGTGLGLAIAKRIVDLHGGRIWVRSTPGSGATFGFEVPVRFETHEEAPPRA